MTFDLSEHEIPIEAILINCGILIVVMVWALNFDLLLVFTVWMIGLLILLGITVFGFLLIIFDWLINPWVEYADMDWASFLTTRHYFTWLYAQDARLWLRAWIFWYLPFSISAATILFNAAAGLLLVILGTIDSFIIIGILEEIKKKPRLKQDEFRKL